MSLEEIKPEVNTEPEREEVTYEQATNFNAFSSRSRRIFEDGSVADLTDQEYQDELERRREK